MVDDGKPNAAVFPATDAVAGDNVDLGDVAVEDGLVELEAPWRAVEDEGVVAGLKDQTCVHRCCGQAPDADLKTKQG